MSKSDFRAAWLMPLVQLFWGLGHGLRRLNVSGENTLHSLEKIGFSTMSFYSASTYCDSNIRQAIPKEVTGLIWR